MVPHAEQNEAPARIDADALKAIDVLEHEAAQRGTDGEYALKGGLGNAGFRQGELGEGSGGDGRGPGVGEVALAKGEDLEGWAAEKGVGERVVAPLGREEEGCLAGVLGGELAEPGLGRVDAAAEGGPGEAEERDGARLGG